MSLDKVFFYKLFPLLIGLIVITRYVGIWHGYDIVYNVDEPALVKTTLGLRFNLFIERFDWPHFNYYFHFFFYTLFIKLRGLVQIFSNIRDQFPIFWNDPFIFYIISRFINTTLSLLSAIPVYLITKKITSSEVFSRFNSSLFLLLPYAGFNSRHAIQDTATMFWISYALLFLFFMIDKEKIKYGIIGAILFGFATGVKYNAALFFVILPLLLMVYYKKLGLTISKFIATSLLFTIIFIVSFFMTTPSAIIYWYSFWSDKSGVGIFWQLNQNLGTFPLVEIPFRLISDLYMLSFDLGIIGAILFVLSILFVYMMKKKMKHWNFVLILSIFSILYIINASRYYLSGSRFYVPVYPLIIIVNSSLFMFLQGKYQVKRVFGVLLLLPLCLFAIFQAYIFSQPTTLNIALSNYRQIREIDTNKSFIKAEDMERINLLNGLKLNTLDDKDILTKGDYIFTSRDLDRSDFELYDTIGKPEVGVYQQMRLGSPIYIYRVK